MSAIEGLSRLLSVLLGLGVLFGGVAATVFGLLILSGGLPLGIVTVALGPLMALVGWRLITASLSGEVVRYKGKWWRRE